MEFESSSAIYRYINPDNQQSAVGEISSSADIMAILNGDNTTVVFCNSIAEAIEILSAWDNH